MSPFFYLFYEDNPRYFSLRTGVNFVTLTFILSGMVEFFFAVVNIPGFFFLF